MGKRVKKKAHNVLKEKRVSNSSPKAAEEENDHPSANVDDGVVVKMERKGCPHLEKVDVAKVSSKLMSAESTSCEECREGMIDRRGGKGKGKHGKKKGGPGSGAVSKATWVCLHCGHFSCGGVGLPDSQQTHAVRHARQSRHPMVMQVENTNLRWCFSCSTLIPVDKSDDNDEQIDALSGIVKLLKKQSVKTTSIDVEDIWFGSGSILNNVKSESRVVRTPNGKDFYAVRGLVNLGNTCFFNSVMQNLLAIDTLREYLLTFDGPMGPLTSALKKIYVETSPELGVRNVINPRSLFGCICTIASQFRGYQQQDSHELLRCLLDGLSNEELCAKKSDKISGENGTSLTASPTFVDAIFGGQTSSTVCCVECGHSSVVHEPFLDLSLPLPTKKPPKKTMPASRTRKTKLPPKKVGKTRPKLNRNGDSRPTVSGCNPSSSSESSSVFKGASLSCSSADNVEPGDVVVRNGLGSQDKDSTLPDNANTQASESGDREDDVIRSDNLEPVTQCDAQEDDSWLDFLGPSTDNDGQEADSLLDFLAPAPLSDDQNLTVKFEDHLVNVEGCKDVNQNIVSFQDAVNSSEEAGVDSADKNGKSQSKADGWEDEHQVQVQDNEVLLLTYKEDGASIMEDVQRDTAITSSAVCDEEENLGFVGLGDLFAEPETHATASAISNDVQGCAQLGNGFLAENSTESDPDEVDNTDAPVSVESCLAHFVKPELLSGEHAWHCENCSKLKQEKRRQVKKSQRKSAPVLQENISEDDCPGSEVVQVRNSPCSDCSTSGFITVSNGCSGEDKNLNQHVSLQINGLGPMLVKEQRESCDPEIGVSDATNVSACAKQSDEAASGGKSVDCCTNHIPVGQLSDTEEYESRVDEEDDDVSSKNVKVMRDATKRILISKRPTILTIHLKRFGQYGRRLSKLNGHVVFKEFIDLRPYLDNRSSVREDCIYRLTGVVEHSGSMRGGHYIAYVRGGDRHRGKSEEHTQKRDVWYRASDAFVRESSLEEVLHSEAYILFYEKVQL